MIHLIFTLCETMAVIECVEHTRDFDPPVPTSCAQATEAWLQTLTPEGSGVGLWRCVEREADVRSDAALKAAAPRTSN